MSLLKPVLVLFLLLNLLVVGATETKPEKYLLSDTLKIATYNVRIKSTADTAARSWDNRKSQVAGVICK